MTPEGLKAEIEQQNQLIRAMEMVGSLVLPMEDEERVLDVLAEQIIETANLRSLLVALVYRDQGYLEIVRTLLYSFMDAHWQKTHRSTLKMARISNRRYDLNHPTAICRAVHEYEPVLTIVDGDDPKLLDDPEYNPDEWKNKVAFFVRLMYRDEPVGVIASACPLEKRDAALDWVGRTTPLLEMISAAIKSLRLLKAQRFLVYHPPSEVHLSNREREVLRRVALGESSENIAGVMGLSPRTVHTYRRRICQKLDRHSQADLTRYAIMTGLIPLTDP